MPAIRRVTLDAFRNYDTLTLEADLQPVALIGENGAGKTNCLEAISLLSPGRGLRRAALSELQNRHSNRPWAASFACSGFMGDAQIGMGRDPESVDRDKRIIRIDGKPARGQTALANHMALLWLTPEMDRLLAEGAGDRRRFLDRLVYVLHPDHLTHINRYDEAMRSRNRLLAEGPYDESWLNALEDNMARDGIAIAAARLHWRQDLAPFLRNDDAIFPPLLIDIEGNAENIVGTEAALDAEEKIRALLKAQRKSDAASGTTQIGPHRSDLKITHARTNCPAELCSTGEQKALLISLVLAQARLLSHLRGSPPILLLDDIMAHLDEARRAALSRQLLDLNAQSWLSGTDAAFFAGFGRNVQFFHVDHAHIKAA